MEDDAMINVEVAFAEPTKQKIIALKVKQGTSMLEAVGKSDIVSLFPQIDLASVKMGIFGKAVKDPSDHLLKPGERVEIYRSLIIDPKEARANRAAKAKQQRQSSDSD